MILFISILFCFSCKEEDLIFENPYQLQTAWKGTGYGQGTILWAKQINLNYEIFYDIIPVHHHHVHASSSRIFHLVS